MKLGGWTVQKKSKSGVLLNKNFRDSLIIDKYDPVFQNWNGMKLQQLRSENSEDVMTWNVFKSLNQINPELWLPSLFEKNFQSEYAYSLDVINILLWKKLNPPSYLSVKEGKTEVDVIIESNQFVWFIEIKYKSDISIRTVNDPSRNQVIRNIDVGLSYAEDKDFYFSLLILDEKHSRKGFSIVKDYRILMEQLNGNRSLDNLKRVGLCTWFDMLDIFRDIKKVGKNEFEIFIVEQAVNWLESKIQKPR